MKAKRRYLLLIFFLLTLPVSLQSGTFHFGITSAVKDKVEEIKEEKEKSKETIPSDNLPTISITSPLENASVSATVTINVTATDDKGISKVEFYIDGTLKETDTFLPYSYSLDTTQYSNGTHIVKAIIYDTANQTASAQHSFTVDNTWKVQTVDSVGNVGVDTSIAVDGNGYPHISYYDVTNRHLKYARWTGSSWNVQTVDATAGVGRPTSLALDASGNPYIAYSHIMSGDLKCAKWTGTSWGIETVDSVNHAGEYASIDIDRNNNPHIVYNSYDATQTTWNRTLKYAKWTGSEWSIETVDPENGYDCSLMLDDNGNSHIAYAEKYAKRTGTSWNIQTVPVGVYTSLTLDDNNFPHISYYMSGANDLRYTHWDGSSWITETVDADALVGWSTSIVLDSNNYPHIAYGDKFVGNLKYAKWDGASWRIETVDDDPVSAVGEYCSMAFDAEDHPHIAYFDNLNGDLKYATK